jgi:hypothetical protein
MSSLPKSLEGPLLFQPNPLQADLDDSFRNIPRYLFRLHGSTTAGTTSDSEVTSLVWKMRRSSLQSKKLDLFQRKPQDAGSDLYHHLTWHIRGGTPPEENCNLMSWTSSLLFAIQYGLYRNMHQERFPRVPLQHLHILLVDTKEFPPGTFVRDLELIKTLLPAYPQLNEIQQWRTRRDRRLYFGEYLSQGSLNIRGHCVQTSLEALINNGLFNLAPALGDGQHWHRLANRVLELRQPFNSGIPRSVTVKSTFRDAITISQGGFGSRWTLPMALMLLSLQPCLYDDSVIVSGLLAIFTGKLIILERVDSRV